MTVSPAGWRHCGFRACRQLLAYLLREIGIERRRIEDGQPVADTMLSRLVHFQLERQGSEIPELPSAFQAGKILCAIYRVGPYSSATGTPQGYALRLLVDPRRSTVAVRPNAPMAMAN